MTSFTGRLGARVFNLSPAATSNMARAAGYSNGMLDAPFARGLRKAIDVLGARKKVLGFEAFKVVKHPAPYRKALQTACDDLAGGRENNSDERMELRRIIMQLHTSMCALVVGTGKLREGNPNMAKFVPGPIEYDDEHDAAVALKTFVEKWVNMPEYKHLQKAHKDLLMPANSVLPYLPRKRKR